MNLHPSLRRIPRQERGELRITRILDAAAQLFDEVGYEATTTVAIAGRAQTAVGSLYQFFPNKDAIVLGLLERYRRQLQTIFSDVLTPELATLPLPQLLDRLIDPLVEFELGQQGFKALFVHVPPSNSLATAVRGLTDEVILRVASVFAIRLPELGGTLCLRYSLICVQLVKAFLALATSSQPLSHAEAIHELKIVLIAYLGPIVD